MPRYYFHVEDHQRFPDTEGTELADLAAAHVEAVRVAGEMIKDHALDFWGTGTWRVVVTDADQLILFSLSFEAVAAPIPARAYQPRTGIPGE